MKKTLLTLALVAATVAAFAQGKAGVGNDSLHYFVIGTALAGDVGGGVEDTAGNTVAGAVGAIPISPLASGRSLVAMLFAGTGTSGANMTLQSSWILEGANWLSPGRMATRGLQLTFPGGTVATLALVIADLAPALGTTLQGDGVAQMYALGALYAGSSRLFQFTPGTSLTYPSIVTGGGTTWTPRNLVINAIPEPSTFALAGLGAAALLIFRRRK